MTGARAVLLLLACAVLPFLPALSSEFVLEDRDLVTMHPVVTGAAAPWQAFTMGFYGPPPPGEAPGPYYRPLVLLLLRGETLLFGSALLPRHLVNLLLHAGCVLLVLRLLARRGLTPLRAWLGAALFAVHPVQAGAVAWVSGRTDVVATIGVLTSLLARRPLLRGASLGLALLGKETALVTPLLAWLLDEGPARARLWRQLPLLAALAAYALLRLGCYPLHLPADALPLARVVPFTPAVLGLYLRHLLVPFPPHWQRAVPLTGSPLAPELLPGLLLLAAAAALALWRKATRPALGWCLLAVLPVCGLLPLAPWQPDAWILSPRFLYLGVGGLALLLASALPPRVLAVLLVPYLGLTAWHALDYRSTAALADAGLRWDQGSAALWQMRADQSIERWERAADPAARTALARTGLDAAQHAVALCPTWYPARRTLAFLMAVAGDLVQSEQLHRLLMRENPGDPMVASNLAVVMAAHGRFQDARALWQEALRRQPDFAPARANLERLERGR